MSTNQRRVILYGDSLILQGVHASLAACPGLDVILLDTSLEKPFEAVRVYSPAAFVFDMAAVPLDCQLSLLRQPDLLLIGLDPETHHALVWSGRQAAAVEAADILNLIRHKDSESPDEALSQAPRKEGH